MEKKVYYGSSSYSNQSALQHRSHKYIRREWVNGKWRYWYDDPSVDATTAASSEGMNQEEVRNFVNKETLDAYDDLVDWWNSTKFMEIWTTPISELIYQATHKEEKG